MRRILEVLAKKGPNGQYAAFGGTSLAKIVEADAGENSVSGSIRRRLKDATLPAARRGCNVLCDGCASLAPGEYTGGGEVGDAYRAVLLPPRVFTGG